MQNFSHYDHSWTSTRCTTPPRCFSSSNCTLTHYGLSNSFRHFLQLVLTFKFLFPRRLYRFQPSFPNIAINLLDLRSR